VSANTAITDASYTLTPARQAIKRVLSDLLAGVDGTGLMREQALAMYNFNAVMKAFDALFATALASLTGTAGTTGVNMTATDLFTAQQTLRSRRATGRLGLVLHPTQFNDLQTDLRGEVGPWQFDPQVAAAVRTSSGDNLLGMLNDIEIWTSDQVATANGGADYGGGMFTLPGSASGAAIAYAEGSPDPVTLAGGRVFASGGVVYTDFDLDIDKADVQLVTNYFTAVSVASAAKGIKVITDA
jgi:hypothetical protein